MVKPKEEPEGQHPASGMNRKLSALDRAIMAALGDGKTVGLEDDPFAVTYPDVWQWLTKTDGGRDYIMQPAVITLQLGPEGALVSLTHRDLRRACTVACPHLGQFMEVLQAALTSPHPPIRSWGKDEAHLKKRRPKA